MPQSTKRLEAPFVLAHSDQNDCINLGVTMNNSGSDEFHELPPLPEYDHTSLKVMLHRLIDTLSMDDSLFLLQLIEFTRRSEDGMIPESVL